MFIAISGQTLGHVALFLGLNLGSAKRTFGLHVGPEVMPLDQIVLGPASDALICSKKEHPIVVHKDGAVDCSWEIVS